MTSYVAYICGGTISVAKNWKANSCLTMRSWVAFNKRGFWDGFRETGNLLS